MEEEDVAWRQVPLERAGRRSAGWRSDGVEAAPGPGDEAAGRCGGQPQSRKGCAIPAGARKQRGGRPASTARVCLGGADLPRCSSGAGSRRRGWGGSGCGSRPGGRGARSRCQVRVGRGLRPMGKKVARAPAWSSRSSTPRRHLRVGARRRRSAPPRRAPPRPARARLTALGPEAAARRQARRRQQQVVGEDRAGDQGQLRCEQRRPRSAAAAVQAERGGGEGDGRKPEGHRPWPHSAVSPAQGRPGPSLPRAGARGAGR
mgnify:CR=1 FL=1